MFAQFKLSVDLNENEQILYETCKEQFFYEEYTESYQGFSQLLSLYPREAVFNYYYGACLVKLNNNIKSGIDYLEYAEGKGINPATFYIGLGYHYLYDFEKALRYYETYKLSARNKDIVNFEVEQYITMANHGIELVKYAYNLNVLSNKKVNRTNFHYSYNLNDFGGSIIVKTDQFKGKADKKNDETELMYISEIHDVLFYSSYGDSRKNSLDIYMSRKENDKWTTPQKLPNAINSKYDEAFPFLSEDGVTLYFSSKGHNSMGGYDIFKTEWDTKHNFWSEPENLDFPINTPFDDIMYAVDRYNETAFFSSTRETTADKISVYWILTEADPQKRKLETMSDIYRHSNLEVNPLAMTELTKRQEIRASTMFDTLQVADNNIKPKDTVKTDADVLIQNSISKLDDMESKSAEYLEYAASAFKLSEIRLGEVKELNKQINQIKNKTDLKTVQLRDSLTNLANEKSLEAAELYDISKAFSDASNQLNGLIIYYRKEVRVLDNTPRNEKSLLDNVKKIDNEINNLKIEFPYNTYLTNLEKDKEQKLEKLKPYKESNIPLQEKLTELNERITVKLDLAKNEKDFDLREKYIYDVKTYENEKIDLIAKIKDNDIQIEFINYEIKGIERKIAIIDESRTKVEDGLFYNPDLNIGSLNNEIELLKISVNQNSLKELASVQDKINADMSLYTPATSLDEILYGTTDIANMEHVNVFVDTEIYQNKFSAVASEKTIYTGTLIAKNDSLTKIVKQKEREFDATTNTSDKNKIIAEINTLQSEIKNNETVINSSITAVPITNLETIISDYNDLKQTTVRPEVRQKITETDKLITDSKDLETEIADLRTLDKTGNSPGIKYLEILKSDIDSKIVENISEIKMLQKQDKPEPKISDIIAELNQQLLFNSKTNTTIKNITAQLQNAQRLFADADKTKNDIKKNDIIVQANEIIDSGLKQSLQYFITSIDKMYSDFETYEKIIRKYNLYNDKTSEYSDKANSLKQNSDKLKIQAETSQSEKIKLERYAEAYQQIELANMYYAYIFSFLQNDRLYQQSKDLINPDESNNFVNLVTSIEKRMLYNVVAENNTGINPEIIATLIEEADAIKNKTEALSIEYESATPQRQSIIINEIKVLNDELDNKILSLNNEIVNAQKEIIIENYFKIEEEFPDKSFDDMQRDIVNFNDRVNKIVDSKDFYMLEEVMISGESIIKKQNEVLTSGISLNINNEKINSLSEISDKNMRFVNKHTQVAENNTNNNNTNNNNTNNNIVSNNNADNNNADNNNADNNLNSNHDSRNIANRDVNPENNSNKQLVEIPDNYRFDYNYDKSTISFLAGTENKLSTLSSNIKINEKLIKEITKSMEYSESLEEYKKLQKKLKKAQQNYLKQLKQYASLSKEYLLTKRDIAEAYYNSNALPTDNKIRPLSDSLNNVGEYDIAQSLALFDVIIKFNGKTPEQSLTDKLYKATGLLKTGLSHINAANDLSVKNDDKNPMVLTYYGITETEITSNDVIAENINNDTNNNTTNNNVTDNNRTNNNVTDNNRTNNNVTDNNRTNNNVTDNNRTNNNVTDNNRTNNNVTDNNRTNNNVTDNNRTNNNRTNTTNNNRYSATETIIDASRGSFYSDRNPIPMLEINDELCYRIQIGAFRQNVANDAFIGLMPIFIESIPGSNLYRYVAGLFYTFNSASTALQKVKAIGYTDAFIIAYYKGRRIQVYEARNVENGGTLTVQPEYIADNNANRNVNNNVNNNNNNNVNANVNNAENTTVTVNRNNTNITVETNLQKTKGVFYCIQIGVYKEQVSSDRLYNLSPLMYDAYGNGFIRHTCGKYYDFNIAIEEQNRIRQLGIKDAFVIAYVDGKRVNNYEAATLISKMETIPKDQIIVTSTGRVQPNNRDNANLADNNNNNNNINNNNNNINNNNNNINNNNNNINNNNPAINENRVTDNKPVIEYYIQLGVFKTDVNDIIKNSFRRLAGNNKLYKLTGNNSIVYRIGTYKSYNSAQAGLNNVRAGGVKDAFVVALIDGKRVDVATARAAEQ